MVDCCGNDILDVNNVVSCVIFPDFTSKNEYDSHEISNIEIMGLKRDRLPNDKGWWCWCCGESMVPCMQEVATSTHRQLSYAVSVIMLNTYFISIVIRSNREQNPLFSHFSNKTNSKLLNTSSIFNLYWILMRKYEPVCNVYQKWDPSTRPPSWIFGSRCISRIFQEMSQQANKDQLLVESSMKHSIAALYLIVFVSLHCNLVFSLPIFKPDKKAPLSSKKSFFHCSP